jgi:hypothetical protein
LGEVGTRSSVSVREKIVGNISSLFLMTND